jgi:3-phosphoshikimate 1-carboxyvinyltransferase
VITAPEAVDRLRLPLDELPDPLPIPTLTVVRGHPPLAIRPPGSKSITNRALVLASLADGESELEGALLDADDAARMIDALRAMGVGIDIRADGRILVRGVAGSLKGGCTLNLNNAGTATRFLTAVACLADEPVVIDGNARMRRRPIGELVALLRTLGITIEELGEPGCVPLRIHPARPHGGKLEIGRTASSQFVSAVLLLAPWTPVGIECVFSAGATSESYIRMTLGLLERVGARGVRADGDPARSVGVGPHPLTGFRLAIEPDASGASYFWGAGAIVPGLMCEVDGVASGSLQGDADFVELLARMGATVLRGNRSTTVAGQDRLRAIDADLALMPDTAMTLAAVACFADGPSIIHGLRTLRVKETDRIEALRTELGRIGVRVDVLTEGHDEAIRISPPPGGLDTRPSVPPVVFDTYDDHRMAMAMALIGLRRPHVQIREPGCVAKTYPTFWADLARLYPVPAHAPSES